MGWIIPFAIFTVINFFGMIYKDNEHRYMNTFGFVFSAICLILAIYQYFN